MMDPDIAQDPEKYGFTVDPLPDMVWDVVPVDRSLTFGVLAQIGGFPADTLLLFNPELRQKATPPGEEGKPYSLNIPRGYKETFLASYTAIASQVGPVLANVQIRKHRVRRGESLYSISKRYGVPIPRIVSANEIRNRHRVRVGQVLSIPLTASAVTARQADVPSNPGLRKVYYTVQPGNALSEIAEAYNVGLSKLRRWNGIRPNGADNIKVGQKLAIWVPKNWNGGEDLAAPLNPEVPDLTDLDKIVYTVRPGDTLGAIAEAHNVGLSKLMLWNGLNRTTNFIRTGQQLVIVRDES